MIYGFIGTGSMTQAMLAGFSLNAPAGNEILIYDIDKYKMAKTAEAYSVKPCESAAEIVLQSDIVVIAVKPDQINDLLTEIRHEIIQYNPTLLSLAAGFPIKSICKILDTLETPVARIIPNINSESFSSVTALYANNYVPVDIKAGIISMLESIGSVVELEESLFDIFTVIASCAPAFLVSFTEAMADAALAQGMPKNRARGIITDMLAGTAKMLTVHNPQEFTERICSPGGATITGLLTLTENGFERAVYKTVDTCMKGLKK